MKRAYRDFRDRLLKLKPSTPMVDVAAAAAARGMILKTDRKGGFTEVPAACNQTITRRRGGC